jgi:hypothetical protein
MGIGKVIHTTVLLLPDLFRTALAGCRYGMPFQAAHSLRAVRELV